MDRQQFEGFAETIVRIFRNQGEDEAVAERDRINRELAEKNLYLWFQGPVGGSYLAFFLSDTSTQPAREVYRHTIRWVSLRAHLIAPR
jgi:hypothetical protein